MLWQIDGTIVEVCPRLDEGHWSRTVQIPTFFINGDIQGIISAEHAVKVAESIVNPTGTSRITCHLYAATVFQVA